MGRERRAVAWRVSCTVCAILVVQVVVCGIAALPPAALWTWLLARWPEPSAARVFVLAFAAIPSYVLFALALMIVSPLASRLTGARTPAEADLQIAAMEWPALNWGRYMVAVHIVRIFAGTLFRSSPVWTFYLRLDGARIGRRVYINTLFTSDHNLLEIGDDVVIGADVHLSAHTVEAGRLKTAGVRLGRGVVIGLDSVVDIGVECGDGCQIAAMSFVPKHAKLEPNGRYAGVPVRRIQHARTAAEEFQV